MNRRPLHSIALLSIAILAGVGFWNWSTTRSAEDPEVVAQERTTLTEVADIDRESSRLVPIEKQTEQGLGTREIQDAAQSEQGAKTKAVDSEEPKKANFEFHLTMQLIDANGSPVRERDIQLGYGLKDHQAHLPTTHTVPFLEKTNSEGRITRPVPFSSEELQFIALWVYDPPTQAKAYVDPVAISPNARIDLGQIALLQVKERYPLPWLAGRILDENKRPLESVYGTLNRSAFAPKGSAGADNAEPGAPWPGWYGTQFVFEPNGRFSAYGPPGLGLADVKFQSDGYESEHLISIQTPNLDLQIEMVRQLWLGGDLVVPQPGPPVEEYGVWVSQSGRGTGVRPDANGKFYAAANSRSLRMEITHPIQGHVLFSREFMTTPSEAAGFGTLDITGHVQVLDFLVIDETQEPLRERALKIKAKGTKSSTGQYSTDKAGRLLIVLPSEVQEFEISSSGKRPSTIKIAELGAQWVFPDAP